MCAFKIIDKRVVLMINSLVNLQGLRFAVGQYVDIPRDGSVTLRLPKLKSLSIDNISPILDSVDAMTVISGVLDQLFFFGLVHFTPSYAFIAQIGERGKNLRQFVCNATQEDGYFDPSILSLIRLPHMKFVYGSGAKRYFPEDGSVWIQAIGNLMSPLMEEEVNSSRIADCLSGELRSNRCVFMQEVESTADGLGKARKVRVESYLQIHRGKERYDVREGESSISVDSKEESSSWNALTMGNLALRMGRFQRDGNWKVTIHRWKIGVREKEKVPEVEVVQRMGRVMGYDFWKK